MYSALFFASFLSATVLPFPSEGLFLLALYKGYDPLICLLLAGTGNSLGGATTYLLGLGGRKIMGKKEIRIGEYVRRFGPVVAILSWLPVVGDAILLMLGFLRSAPLPTLVWMTAGKFARYALLAWLYAIN